MDFLNDSVSPLPPPLKASKPPLLCNGIVSSTPAKPGGYFTPFENDSFSQINLQTRYQAKQSIPKGNNTCIFNLKRFYDFANINALLNYMCCDKYEGPT